MKRLVSTDLSKKYRGTSLTTKKLVSKMWVLLRPTSIANLQILIGNIKRVRKKKISSSVKKISQIGRFFYMISQLSIFFTTSSGVYFDLRRNPSAPRARALFSSSTHSRFVLTITFVERLVFDLSTLSISNPSIFGIMISRMMISGFICAALVIPSSPSYAETTVHHSPRNAMVYISLIL